MKFSKKIAKPRIPTWLLGLVVFLGIFSVIIVTARNFTPPLLSTSSFSKILRDRNQKLLRITLSGDQKYRLFTPLDKIDPKFVETVLLQEDRYFDWHFGVNPIALAKATWDTVLKNERRGASTITMQLSRLLRRENTKTISKKIYQIIDAVKIEWLHSKEEIIEAYLNLVPMGGNIEGVGAASQIYFTKAPDNLALSERIALALIPQSPTKRNLSKVKVSSEWKSRRKILFSSWIKLHPEDSNLSVDISHDLSPKNRSPLPFEAPHFIEQIISQNPNKHSYVSSLDLNTQHFIENRIKAYVQSKKSIGINNATALLLNYETGEVLAYVGSADFFNKEISGQVDGIQANRSPGSALKPFVYALAFEEGITHTQTLLRDTPRNFGSFDPENFDRGFLGPLSTSDALIHSRNIPAVELSYKLKNINLFNFLKSQDIQFSRPESYYGLGLVLGGAEISMENLLRLYAGLARNKPLSSLNYFRHNSTDSRFPDLDSPLAGEWPISPEASWMTLNVLSTNPRTNADSFLKWSTKRLDVAWKTGTSSGFRDAWTLGVFGPYALGVWVGNFSGEGNPAFLGRKAAAPLFFNIAEGLWEKENFLSENNWNDKLTNLNIKKIEVCSVSGAEPELFCPHRKNAWVIPGKSPISKCKIHKHVLVNSVNSKRACPGTPVSRLHQFKTLEQWPSDLARAYKSFGIIKKPLPEFEQECKANNDVWIGGEPEIVSPRKGVTYVLRLSASEEEKLIPLQAISEGDVKSLNWFSNQEYLGKTNSKNAYMWKAHRGRHLITVVDDQGRSKSQWLEVKYVP